MGTIRTKWHQKWSFNKIHSAFPKEELYIVPATAMMSQASAWFLCVVASTNHAGTSTT
jgi:hypothetical protein